MILSISKWISDNLTVDDLVISEDTVRKATNMFETSLSEVEKDPTLHRQRKQQIKYVIEEMVEHGKIRSKGSKRISWEIINKFYQKTYGENAPEYVKYKVKLYAKHD